MEQLQNDGRIPGGPTTEAVITERKGHRSEQVFSGKVDYSYMRTRNHTHLSKGWDLSQAQLDLIAQAGFGHYNQIKFSHHDTSLCYNLAERFWPETCTFHFSFGEMAITLEDTLHCIGLSITGTALSAPYLKDCTDLVRRCLGVDPPEGTKNGIKLPWLRQRFGKLPPDATQQQITCYTRAYLLALCATLFSDGTGNRVSASYLVFFEDLSRTSGYAWGAAVLAYLYQSLTRFALCKNEGIYGCMTLLQVWAHEHLPVGRPKPSVSDPLFPRALVWMSNCKKYLSDPHHSVTAYRTQLDLLAAGNVMWTPYVISDDSPPMLRRAREDSLHRACVICMKIVHFHPADRVMRQFRLIQTIPDAPGAWSSKGKFCTGALEAAIRDWDARLHNFQVIGDPITMNTPAPCATPQYCEWFGSPRIHNPTLTHTEPRYMPQGYFQDYYSLRSSRLDQELTFMREALQNPNTDYQEAFRHVYDRLSAPLPPSCYAPPALQQMEALQVPAQVPQKHYARRHHQEEPLHDAHAEEGVSMKGVEEDHVTLDDLDIEEVHQMSTQPAEHWIPEYHKVWIDLCLDQVQKGNRSTTDLNSKGYKVLCEEFFKKTGKRYDKKEMKNHWDRTKDKWEVWHKLTTNTGSGWDPLLQSYSADDAWWTEYLLENPKAAEFRHCGLRFATELDILFGGSTATIVEQHAPNSGILPHDDPMQPPGVEDASEIVLEMQQQSSEDDIGFMEPAGSCPRTRKTTQRFKRKKLSGAAKYNNMIDTVNPVEPRTGNSTTLETVRPELFTIKNCIDSLNELSEVIPVGSALYYVAVKSFLDKDMREVFMSLPVEARLGWVKLQKT